MTDLHAIDRRARGLERAVLAYSYTSTPIVLDRTLASLAGIRRWLAEVPAANRDAIRDYLVITAASLRGADIDVHSVPDLDSFERWIADEPTHGPAWRRPHTATLKAWCAVGQGVLASVRELVLGMAPLLADGEEHEDDDPWSWSLVVDSDELRADAEDEHVSVTITLPDRDAIDAELTRMYAVVVEIWGACTLAVAYDPDSLDALHYLRRGLAAGLPRWLFGGSELADVPGATMIANTDPQAYRVPFTRDLIATRQLVEQWPHDSP